MTEPEGFTMYAEAVARAVGISGITVKKYANLGFVEHARTKTGRWLLKPSAVARVRAIYEERMKTTGRPAWRRRVKPDGYDDYEPEVVAGIVEKIRRESGEAS